MMPTDAITYTTRAQRVFSYAQQEASERGQRYLGPEHLLLGLLREPDNLACTTLKRLHVPLAPFRERADRRMAREETTTAALSEESDVRFTPRAHRVLALACHEARLLRHNSVGTEHLLLGLVHEREGLPGRLLARNGVTLAAAREAVEAEVGGRPLDLHSVAPAAPVYSATVQDLLASLRHDGRTGHPILPLEWLVFYMFACLAFFAVLLRTQPWDDEIGCVVYVGLCVAVLRWGYLIINNMVASPQQRRAAKRLTQLQDKRLVGHLVDFSVWPDEPVRQAAKRALIQMLPQLKPADAGLISPAQQGVLRSFLHRRYSDSQTELQIAILQAYEQIGDERAMTAVQGLANLNARTRDRQRVKDAANSCLPFLQQRRERQHSSQTLLRPTTAAEATPPREVLLRPAAEQSGANPAELLRANLGSNSET
jgi:hypothetical protein